MITVKVVSIFRDKDTNERYVKNKKLEVSKERYEEIKEFVKVLKEQENEIQEEIED